PVDGDWAGTQRTGGRSPTDIHRAGVDGRAARVIVVGFDGQGARAALEQRGRAGNFAGSLKRVTLAADIGNDGRLDRLVEIYCGVGAGVIEGDLVEIEVEVRAGAQQPVGGGGIPGVGDAVAGPNQVCRNAGQSQVYLMQGVGV